MRKFFAFPSKSEYFCLCQKTIVTWYRFLFSFPNKVFALLTALFVDFLSLFNKVIASLRALFIEQEEDILCEGIVLLRVE